MFPAGDGLGGTADTETVLVPGARDVRGTLDRVSETDRAEAVVVACPPHPQHGGSRSNRHLAAIGEAMNERGVDCLRFDYGEWAEGSGEQADARNAVDWAAERYARVGLFGYSFGGQIAILVAGDSSTIDALSALAPHQDSELDPASVVARVECPSQLVYGARDDTADWEPVAAAAREANWTLAELDADHLFVGRSEQVAETVADFLASHLR